MKDFWRGWTAIGFGLLAYSGLLAPWVGTRAVPQLVGDLWKALHQGGDVVLVGRLLAAFLALYGFVIAIAFLGWLCFYRRRALAGAWALVASAGGVMVAGYLAAQGAEWEGAFAAVLGFLLVGSGCYVQSRRLPLPWQRARALAVSSWAQRARAARADGAPAVVAVCRDVLPLTAKARSRLARRLRENDAVVFFVEGAIFWLGATPCEGAREAVQRLQRQFPSKEAAFCGLACAAGEGIDVAALLNQAAAAQAFAAAVGVPVQEATEAVLPPPLRTTPDALPTDAALLEAVVAAWEALPAPRQVLVVHFSPLSLGAALEGVAREALRTGDRVLPLPPYRLLVLLPRTEAAGLPQVQVRLRRRLAALAEEAGGTVVVYRLAGEKIADGESLLQAAFQASQKALDAAAIS